MAERKKPGGWTPAQITALVVAVLGALGTGGFWNAFNEKGEELKAVETQQETLKKTVDKINDDKERLEERFKELSGKNQQLEKAIDSMRPLVERLQTPPSADNGASNVTGSVGVAIDHSQVTLGTPAEELTKILDSLKSD